MQEWYNGTTKSQKVLLYATCVPLILVYGLGIIGLILLLYCEFGKDQKTG